MGPTITIILRTAFVASEKGTPTTKAQFVSPVTYQEAPFQDCREPNQNRCEPFSGLTLGPKNAFFVIHCNPREDDI